MTDQHLESNFRSRQHKLPIVSSTWVTDSGRLFSLILILIVSPEINNYEFYQCYIVSRSLTIIPCSMGTDFCLKIIQHSEVNQSLPFSIYADFFHLPDLMPVFSSRKLNSKCITFVDAMVGFNMVRGNTATNFVENIQYLLLQYFPTNFTRSVYNVQTFSSWIPGICTAFLLQDN